MIWTYVKISENDKVIVYSYAWGSDKSEPGEILYDKETKETKIVKVASNNDTMGSEWAIDNFVKVINEGFPNERRVMIG
ncbi:MAG: hypothetical protein FWD87_05075 [Spirochaetaceae bacterium]|nr:hypothetical protein [Spirochaetaceae bacterium]